MPVVALDKEGAEDIIDGYMAHMKPMAYELVFSKDTPEIQRLIKKSPCQWCQDFHQFTLAGIMRRA